MGDVSSTNGNKGRMQPNVAADNTIEGIRDYLGLDSLHYLSPEGLVEATGLSRDHFCLACFTGEYPIEPDKNFTKEAFSGCGC